MADQDTSQERGVTSLRKKDSSSAEKKRESLIAETVRALAPEILRSVEDANSVNVNFVLADLSQKTENPQDLVGLARELLEIAATYNEQDVQAFRDRVTAVIRAKIEDPDEIDKRKDNQVRRGLKWIIGALASVGFVGSIACGMLGCSAVVTGSLLVITIVALGILGSLASGESLSAKDVAQIIRAASEVVGSSSDTPATAGSRRRRKNRSR